LIFKLEEYFYKVFSNG